MRKAIPATLFIIFGLIGSIQANPNSFDPRYKPKASDFVISDIQIAKEEGKTILNVAIFFKQSTPTFIAYPKLGAITNLNGDTLGDGHRIYYGHGGQDTQYYALTLRNDIVPKFEECLFLYSGAYQDNFEDAVILKYNENEKLPDPVEVPLDCNALKIVGIRVYNPAGLEPQLEIAIHFNESNSKMLSQPYLKYVKTSTGETYTGFDDNIEYVLHRGQDTLMYRIFIDSENVPDLYQCEYYFCCPDDNGKGKEKICKLFFNESNGKIEITDD